MAKIKDGSKYYLIFKDARGNTIKYDKEQRGVYSKLYKNWIQSINELLNEQG